MSQVDRIAEELSNAVLRLGRRLRRQTAGEMSAIDVALLATIHRHPEFGPSELAGREGMSKPSMSIHLKRLTGRGLLRRVDGDVSDRRRVRFRVTSSAQSTLARAQSRRTSWLADRLGTLDEAELALVESAIVVFTGLLQSTELEQGSGHDRA